MQEIIKDELSPKPAPSKVSVSGQAWGRLLKFIATQLDSTVDAIKEKHPGKYIAKCNLSDEQADRVGEHMAKEFGALDSKWALVIELGAIFAPPIIGIIAVVLPPSWIARMTENFHKFTDKYSKEKDKDGKAVPA